jgi:hypothetical protein
MDMAHLYHHSPPRILKKKVLVLTFKKKVLVLKSAGYVDIRVTILGMGDWELNLLARELKLGTEVCLPHLSVSQFTVMTVDSVESSICFTCSILRFDMITLEISLNLAYFC